MAGIYIHIPFCKQACHYCNFHFSTSTRLRSDLVAAIRQEIAQTQDFLPSRQLDSIYFGGGTPSVLPIADLKNILEDIAHYYNFDPETVELTLEANPDDLTLEYLEGLKSIGINRLSIGIQSFHEADLQFMNRAHNSNEALSCILTAQAVGFQNFNIDLIYGSPSLTDEGWKSNLKRCEELSITHLSCYCLTQEPKTAYDYFVQKGKVPPVDDEKAARQFKYLMEQAPSMGFEQYEISNFARSKQYARHNTAYWQGKAYLGIGPAAHSYRAGVRYWNIANNAKYIKGIQAQKPFRQTEILSLTDRYNEYVMTGLRTKWGIQLEQIRTLGFADHFLLLSAPFVQEGLLLHQAGNYHLPIAGRLLADHIASELFFVEED